VNSYADGINYNHVRNGLIIGCHIQKSDDDCIALGLCENVVVAGNLMEGRTDVSTLVPVTSITRSGSTATVTYPENNFFSLAGTVVIAGADQAEYNGTFSLTPVGNGYTQGTFTVAGSPATPATGTITIRQNANAGLTTWGRGIYVGGGGGHNIIGNSMRQIKQMGIKVISEDGERVIRTLISGNQIRECCLISGLVVELHFVTDVTFRNNGILVESAAAGIEIGDWQGLTISDNTITVNAEIFCRLIHASEAALWEGRNFSSPFRRLHVLNNSLVHSNGGAGAASTQAIRVDPAAGSRWEQQHTLITGNSVFQAPGNGAGSYIGVDYCTASCKIVNNTETLGASVATGSNNTVAPTTANNN
jgi:hypothetical protein